MLRHLYSPAIGMLAYNLKIILRCDSSECSIPYIPPINICLWNFMRDLLDHRIWIKLLAQHRQPRSVFIDSDVSPTHPAFSVEGRPAVQHAMVVHHYSCSWLELDPIFRVWTCQALVPQTNSIIPRGTSVNIQVTVGVQTDLPLLYQVGL